MINEDYDSYDEGKKYNNNEAYNGNDNRKKYNGSGGKFQQHLRLYENIYRTGRDNSDKYVISDNNAEDK